MELKDVLIMEVPSEALKKVIKSKNIEAKLSSSEDMATAIAQKDVSTGNYLANEFQFAGSTSVNLNILMSSISAKWHNKDNFKRELKKRFTDKIFTTGIRPELDARPKLIKAHDQNEKIVLAFSFLGRPRRYLENFQIVSRRQQVVEYVVVHFSPFAVEVRASHEQNKNFRDSVLEIMGISDEVVWDKATKLSDEQALELAKALNARLRSAKHKMTEGVYATKEVTAKTQVEDLESTEQYQKEFSNQPMKKKTLIFDYEYSFGYQDKISYVITDESLWIRSKVGEEVISFILDQIIKIRYPSDIDSQDEIESFEEDTIVLDEHIDSDTAVK